jgi:hypothetical protein
MISETKYYIITRNGDKEHQKEVIDIANEIFIRAYVSVNDLFFFSKRRRFNKITKIAYELMQQKKEFLDHGYVCIRHDKLGPVERFFYQIEEALSCVTDIKEK